MASTELETKTARLVELLEREDLAGVLLSSQHNFAWLTGGGRNGIDLSRENGAASLLVMRSGRRCVIANNIEMPRILAEECSPEDFDPVEFAWQDEKANADTALNVVRGLNGSTGELVTDIPMFTSVRAVEGRIAPCRWPLTGEELERYRLLGRDASAAMKRTIHGLHPGETERQVALRLERELSTDGISSVVTLAAADERIAQYRHPVPTQRRWQNCLLIVTCAKRHGLIVSLSRMVGLNTASSELTEKTEAAAYVNSCLLNATRPEASGAELYAIAGAAYSARGFAREIDRHHQGGAAGYRTRDWVAHPASRDKVQTRQAFAWNPSITGTKVEDTWLTTESGIENLTLTAGFPVIVHSVNGIEYSSHGVISL